MNGTGMNGIDESMEMPATDNELPGAAEMEEHQTGSTDAAPVSQDEYDQVRRERDQLLDRLARMQAEFDNARKRDAKERADFRDYAVGSAAEGLLPVLDNFALALKAKGTPEQFRTGVELIAKQLDDAVRALGVTPVEAEGSPFDPHLHEALGQLETTEHPDGTVLQEVRRGYRIKDRLLRPALVQVARNTAQREA